jgi:hypothetical protein
MVIIECYHLNRTLSGDSVIIMSGFVKQETGTDAVRAAPEDESSRKSQSVEKAYFTGGLSDGSDEGRRRESDSERSNVVRKNNLLRGSNDRRSR